MAESNLPKQDFAPPWLKFPSADTTKATNQSNYQNERNRQRREDPYHSRSDYNRLLRQTSFDYHDGKRYTQGQGKYRHHSIDDDYYGYPYGGYAYYTPSYSYEKYGMQYSSQPSLARSGNRDGKHTPGRFSQGLSKRGYNDKEHQKDTRDVDGKVKEKNGERDRPFSEEFPVLKGSGENTPDIKQAKPASGVWDNPPKASRNEETPELMKNTPSGVYKAIVLSKNGQIRKNGHEGTRLNGSIRDCYPVSPSNRSNHKEGTRNSPTPDLAIVTQPKKLGDRKSEFLKALRSESSLRNGESAQYQNSIDKQLVLKETLESPMNTDVTDHSHLNGNHEHKSSDNSVEPSAHEHKFGSGLDRDCAISGEALIKHVDHIYLSGEEEEKRLLESMGWSEEDKTEYVITDDDVKEFHHMLDRVRAQSELGNSTRRSLLRLKLGTHFANGLLNGT